MALFPPKAGCWFPREETSRSLPLRQLRINKPWTRSITASEEGAAGEDSVDLANATTTVDTYKVGTLVVDLLTQKLRN